MFGGATNWTGCLLFITSAIFIYSSSIIIYRVFFHPLARYPGPFIAKITDFYSTYHAWTGGRHLEFHRCHEKYGSIVRYGPSKVSFNTYTALHSIHQAKANVRKSDFYNTITPPSVRNVLTVTDKDMHARKRRIMSQVFSDKAVKSMEDYMLVHIRTFCERLASAAEPLDMAKWSGYLTADVLGELCFGKSFEMLTSEKNREMREWIIGAAQFALIFACGWPLVNTPIPMLFRKMLSGRLRFRAFNMACAYERMQMPANSRKDFYHYLMEPKPDATETERYSEAELWAEAGNLIVAGSDTSSLVLSATFFYLTHNPQVLAKAAHEVRQTFGDVEEIRDGRTLVGDCRYLKACLDESMRMTPPVPGALPRIVMFGGINVDGQLIPEHVEVSTPIYALQHNLHYYSSSQDSFAYRPERWLVPRGEGEDVPDFWKAFSPFSYGPRGCVGKGMAYAEMMLAMARVLFLFDLEAKAKLGEGGTGAGHGRERKDEYQVRDEFICGNEGPIIAFKRRTV